MLSNNECKKRLFLILLYLAIGFIYWSPLFGLRAHFYIYSLLILILIKIISIDNQSLKRLLLVALFIRVLLAIIRAYTAIDIPGAGADSLAFEEYAWDYAQAWHVGDYTAQGSDAYRYYSALIGFCYYYFGRIELIPQLINVSVGLNEG